MREKLDVFVDDLPEFDPVVFHEKTDYGWRGLTAQGEVLEVRSSNGHAIEAPSEMTVAHLGRPVGRRKVTNVWKVDIDEYLDKFNRVITCYKQNDLKQALMAADDSLRAAPTLRAKFNRAMVLLAAGIWQEGFVEYGECEEQMPFTRPQVRTALDAGMTPWRGEDIRGKKLLLMHAHGFGDSIQCLRYVPALQAMGADVRITVPPELESLAAQMAPVTYEGEDCDYFCPLLHLLRWLSVTPVCINNKPYLKVDPSRALVWGRINPERRSIGLAWSVGKPSLGDYPREISLKELVDHFGPDVDLYSVQAQGAQEAERFGVKTYAFNDFVDCAALMSQMDQIISVDTAALHLAGAIGHQNVVGLLSHWHSWRWIAPWYQSVRLIQQTKPDDWASALAQI